MAAFALIGIAFMSVPVSAQGGFKVIVNETNPHTELTREAVSRIFLKKTSTWSSGKPATPVDLVESSAARMAFSRAVLRMDVAAVKGYWQSAIFSGRGVPPSAKALDSDVIAFVRDTPGAIGYVRGNAVIDEGVKVLRIVE